VESGWPDHWDVEAFRRRRRRRREEFNERMGELGWQVLGQPWSRAEANRRESDFFRERPGGHAV
jgi:hypothetical protein